MLPRNLSAKDRVTLSLSTLALTLSLFATGWSILQGRYEQQRLLRSQLSEVLMRIVSTDVEQMKLPHDLKDQAYVQNISNALGYQHNFLLRQAMFLADQIPALVTDVEYNTIAVGNQSSGDFLNAEKYFKRSIDVAPNAQYQSVALGSYANFLFLTHRFEEARKEYQMALSALVGNDNSTRYGRGLLYQEWAGDELNLANSATRSLELFESARNEFNGIDVEPMKRSALQSLQAAEEGQVTQVSPPPVGPPPGAVSSGSTAPSH